MGKIGVVIVSGLLLSMLLLGGCALKKENAEGIKKNTDASVARTEVFKGVSDESENEEVVFSFITENEKKLILTYNKVEDKLVYRFINREHQELMLPNADQNPWEFFTYADEHTATIHSAKNMDMNYLFFVNAGYRYEIFDNYNVAGQGRVVGVDVINMKDQSVTHIEGDAERAVGSLMLLNEKFPSLVHENLLKSQ